MFKMIEDVSAFVENNRSFLEYVKEWEDGLPAASWKEIAARAGGPDRVAVVVVDMVEGFCRSGILSSPRVGALTGPVTGLLREAHGLGVVNIALTQDAHEEGSREFGAFPPHCVAGSPEADTVKEIQELPFFPQMKIFPKKSISSGIHTGLEEWLLTVKPRVIVAAGDCTDLCTYQLAMFLRLLANSMGLEWEVYLPLNCVETYDLPVEVARSIGAMAHPGGFFNAVFTYHMALNGVKVVREIK